MAKKDFKQQEEMTLEEARALRAAAHVAVTQELSLEDKREAFRIFWAQNKKKYQKSKEIEQIIWVHLKAIKKTNPAEFEAGIEHFGLKKIGK